MLFVNEMVSQIRKVLLVGVAALFLATGTAQAGEGYFECGPNPGKTGDPTSRTTSVSVDLYSNEDAIVIWVEPRSTRRVIRIHKSGGQTTYVTLNGKRCREGE
jgi:hypothetical protein